MRRDRAEVTSAIAEARVVGGKRARFRPFWVLVIAVAVGAAATLAVRSVYVAIFGGTIALVAGGLWLASWYVRRLEAGPRPESEGEPELHIDVPPGERVYRYRPGLIVYVFILGWPLPCLFMLLMPTAPSHSIGEIVWGWWAALLGALGLGVEFLVAVPALAMILFRHRIVVTDTEVRVPRHPFTRRTKTVPLGSVRVGDERVYIPLRNRGCFRELQLFRAYMRKARLRELMAVISHRQQLLASSHKKASRPTAEPAE